MSPSAPPNPPPNDASDRVVPLVSAQTFPSKNKKKRLRRSDVATADSDSEFNASSEPESETERKLRLNAKKLYKKIKNGQEKRLQESTDDRAFQLVVRLEGEGVDLKQVENALSELETCCDQTDKRKKWIIWYFLACFRMVNEETWEQRWGTKQGRKKNRKHKPFEAAKVVNLIINKLVGLDGLAAMGVYGILAGKQLLLSCYIRD